MHTYKFNGTCIYYELLCVDINLLSIDVDIILGQLDNSPAPDRRFWGGGIFISTQRVPTDGTAMSVTYTALLNTQGTNNVNFTFQFLLFRLDIQGNLVLVFWYVEPIFIGDPIVLNDFEATIRSGKIIFPGNGLGILEGDYFGAFIPNSCNNTVCPAQVALLSQNCQFSSYYVQTGAYVISLNNVREVPMQLNMEMQLGKYAP